MSFVKIFNYRVNAFSCYRYLQKTFTSTSNVLYSTKKITEEPTIVVSEDGNSIFCWHPEPSFPYEHTKPLPRNEVEIMEGESVLKVQHLRSLKNQYRPDGPTDSELSEMFTTTVHPWRHMPQKRKRKTSPPKDRESI